MNNKALKIIVKIIVGICILGVALGMSLLMYPSNAIGASMPQKVVMVDHTAGIPTMGVTADQRYPVYKLVGDVNAGFFISGKNVYPNGELITRMIYIHAADVKRSDFDCGFICKNDRGQVVGLNPLYKGEIYRNKDAASSIADR